MTGLALKRLGVQNAQAFVTKGLKKNKRDARGSTLETSVRNIQTEKLQEAMPVPSGKGKE